MLLVMGLASFKRWVGALIDADLAEASDHEDLRRRIAFLRSKAARSRNFTVEGERLVGAPSSVFRYAIRMPVRGAAADRRPMGEVATWSPVGLRGRRRDQEGAATAVDPCQQEVDTGAGDTSTRR
jgi:hypothetical protein